MDSGHVLRGASVSPFRHRKVDDRYVSDFDNSDGPDMMHAASVSPFHNRKVDDRYRPDFDNSISPRIRVGSLSPLHRRKMDDDDRSHFDNLSRPYAMHAGSVSPLHHRKVDDHYRSEVDNSRGPRRGRAFGDGRVLGRFRDFSPSYVRGRGGGRPGRVSNMHGFVRGSFRNSGAARNCFNMAPREGDWMCSDPFCGNLNFARRDYCNKCDKPRFGPAHTRRKYPGPPRFSSLPLDRSPVRDGYRSPPHGWSRDDPREFRPHIKHVVRFDDHHMRRERGDISEDDHKHVVRFDDHHMRRERGDIPEDDRRRGRFDRPVPLAWEPKNNGRNSFSNDRRVYVMRSGRVPLSTSPPPPPPHHDRWARDMRKRSRSPVMGGPPRDHHHSDSFVARGRGPRHGMSRGRFEYHS